MKTRNELIYFLEIIVGLGLIIATSFEILSGWFSGLGGMLLAAGIINITIQYFYRANGKLAEKIDIIHNDERNLFISDKAKSLAFKYFIVVMAIAVVFLRSIGYEIYSRIIAYSVLSLITIYWVVYFWLLKKY